MYRAKASGERVEVAVVEAGPAAEEDPREKRNS
jgi:hypothetical protein